MERVEDAYIRRRNNIGEINMGVDWKKTGSGSVRKFRFLDSLSMKTLLREWEGVF